MRRKTSALLLAAGILSAFSLPTHAIDVNGMRTIGNALGLTSAYMPANMVVIDCEDKSQVCLQVLAPDLVRVRTSFQQNLPSKDHSWAIDRDRWRQSPAKVIKTKDAVTVETSALRVVVTLKPLLIAFYDIKTGRLINTDSHAMQFDPASGAVAATKSLGATDAAGANGMEEHFYGLGEKAAHLDKLHQKFEMWSSDTPGYTIKTDPIYQSIPFYIGLLTDPAQKDHKTTGKRKTSHKEESADAANSNEAPGLAYGIFFDNSFRTHFDMGLSDPKNVSFQSEGGEMNYYFIYGPSMKTVVSRYTELTGRMPLPPKWALGNQQSRWSYASEKEVKDIVTRYRADKIPLDVIHLDIDYMDNYRVFTFNHDRFPDPPGLMKWLADRGVKAVTIIDPGVKYEPGGAYKVFNEGTAHDYFLKQTDGKPYVGKVWPGQSVFVDYTLPEAAKWWGDLHSSLVDAGVSGIWNDMNEPADFESRDGLKWKDVVNFDDGNHSKHAKMRNLFAMLECKATYEGLSRLRPNERPYIITRSGYAGIQRYATMWTGDCNSTWDSLALSIPMFETLGLCGEPFVGADCGGFIGQTNGELLTRWYQVGFLSPFFRNHHEKGDNYQEPWRFGQQYEDIIRKYVELRYRLLPHLYTVLAESHETGMPWIRPLIFEYQNDKNVVGIDDEFMVGDKLLCAPVLKAGLTSRDVYLPAGEWYDFFTNEKYKGGQHILAQAPLDKVPLFVKAGSILPTGPVVDFIGQDFRQRSGNISDHNARGATVQPVQYEVFPDSTGNATGNLYEDDGRTQEYLNGVCDHRTLKFTDGKLTSNSDQDTRETSVSADFIVLHHGK
jgi:alpha-glucosidase